MVTGALLIMLVLLASLLAAFIYQIVTTPLTAVDAPTLARSAAAASAAAAPELPVRQPRASAATGPAHRTAAAGASRTLPSWSASALTIAGLAAVALGGWLFLQIAHGAAVCTHQAIEVCSQGFVLLTGTQLAGGAIAVAGMSALVMAIVLALR
jgi:hypothetical protein